MADAIEKADAAVAKAEKKLKSWGMFGNKYEEAAELLEKAANQYKLAKSWRQAGETYEKLVQCQLKLDSKHEAAAAYVDAANAYKKLSTQEAVRCLQAAVDLFLDMSRLSMAAKHYKEIAELYEKDERLEQALAYFSKAADLFSGEEVKSSANQCLLKVAQYSAELEKYPDAIQLYEQVALQSLDNNLLRYSVKGYLLSAGLCHVAGSDIPKIRAALDRYQEMDPSFSGSRELKFLQDITDAMEEGDAQRFATVVYEFDSMTRLDPWKTSMLLRAKKKISSREIEEEDLT